MDTTLLITIIGLSIVVIGLLVMVVVTQRREINDLKRPKFGFLGKPLYSLIAFLAVAGFLGLAFFPRTTTPPDIGVGNELIQARIDNKTEVDDQGQIVYVFNAIPIIQAVDWGKTPKDFQVYWKVEDVNGSVIFEHFETKINISEPGGIKLQLQPGEYKISAFIQSANLRGKAIIPFKID